MGRRSRRIAADSEASLLSMGKYLLRRTISGLVALVLFTAFMFFLIDTLVPGDYFTPARLGMTGPEVEALRHQYGLDRPVYIRYLFWLRNVITHGLGQTTVGFMRHGTVTSALPATVLVFFIGIALAYLLGAWLGRIAAWKRGGRGRALTFLAVTTYTLFPPFLGFLLVHFLGQRVTNLKYDVLGTSVDVPPALRPDIMWKMTITIIVAAVIVLVLGVLATRTFGRRRLLSAPLGVVLIAGISVGWWAHKGILDFTAYVGFDAVVPILAFGILSYGDFLLVTRTSIAGVMHDDYVMTAIAKGMPERIVRDRHAGRNAIFPVLGRLVVSLPYLLSGLVIIEQSVGWNGLGTVLFDAITFQDLPVCMDVLLVIGIFTLVARLAFDVAQAVLDPRVWRPV